MKKQPPEASLSVILERLDASAGVLGELVAKVDSQGAVLVGLGEKVDSQGAVLEDLGARVGALGVKVESNTSALGDLGVRVDSQSLVLEDMRSQNRLTIEAVEGVRVALEQRIDRLDQDSRSRDALLELAIRDLRVASSERRLP